MAKSAIIYLVALQLAGTNPCAATSLEVATTLDDSCQIGGDCAMSALQIVRAQAPIHSACNLRNDSHELDLPIAEAAEKNPNFLDEARCLYGQMYSGTACVDANAKQNFFLYTSFTDQQKKSEKNRLLTVRYDNRTIITHRDEAVSDMICDSMQWLGKDDPVYMGHAKGMLTNFAGWRWVAGLACTDLFKNFPDMKKMSFRQAVSMLRNFAPPSDGAKLWTSKATRTSLRRLAAAKCLVGEAGCQMAHCLINVCKDKKHHNLFHHGSARCQVKQSSLSTVKSEVVKGNTTPDSARIHRAAMQLADWNTAAQKSWNKAWQKAAKIAAKRSADAQKAWNDAWTEAATAAAEQLRQVANSSHAEGLKNLSSYVQQYSEGMANATHTFHDHMEKVSKAWDNHLSQAVLDHSANASDTANVSGALHDMAKAGEALRKHAEQANLALQEHVTEAGDAE